MSGTNGNGTSGNVPFDELTCERYLLGELSEPEQERFESAYFGDDGFFNRFLAVKDELLDLYARDQLDVDKKERLESHFQATPPRQRRLHEAHDFINSLTLVADRKAPRTAVVNVVPVARHGVLDSLKRMFSIPALAGVGALLILLFVALWMIKPDGGFQISVDSVVPGDTSPGSSDVAESPLPNTEPDNDPHVAARGNSEQSRRKPKQPEVEVASSGQADQPPANAEPQPGQLQAVQPPVNGVQPPPQQFAKHDEPPQSPIPEIPDVMKPLPPSPDTGGERAEYVTLSSASRSATKSNTASISAATRSLVVRLLFSGEAYTSYAVRVSTLGGGTVWWMSRLKASMKDGARSLSVTIPASALSRKDYIVVLEGLSKEGRLETIREYYLRVDRH